MKRVILLFVFLSAADLFMVDGQFETALQDCSGICLVIKIFKRACEFIRRLFVCMKDAQSSTADITPSSRAKVRQDSNLEDSKRKDEGTWIESKRVVNWGSLHAIQLCPDKMYVDGFQLKVHDKEKSELGDNTALNGIRLFCNNMHDNSKQITDITSGIGPWGHWKKRQGCPGGYLTGFQLNVKENSGDGDDTAVNDLRMTCSKSEIGELKDGGGLNLGKWSSKLACPKNHAICGIRTQVQEYQGSAISQDDTALNNVDMKCCPIIAD